MPPKPHTLHVPARRVNIERLVSHLDDVIYRLRVTPSIAVDYVSGATTRVSGYTPSELYADPRLVFAIVHPNDRRALEELTRQGPTAEPLLLRWIDKDGTTIWTETRNTAIYDESGQLRAIEGIARVVCDPTCDPGATIRLLGALRIDLAEQRVYLDGAPVRLSPSEFRLLACLSARPGQTISRAELMRQLWHSPHAGSAHACETYISRLRRKLERDPHAPERIITVRGHGYKLLAA